MKTLTIRQPWTSLILSGQKDVENRSWKTSYRGPILIHAAAATDRDAIKAGIGNPDSPTGVILGVVTLVDIVTDSDSPWAEEGQFHWILADPKPFAEPIPARGALGLWNSDVEPPADPEPARCGRCARKLTSATSIAKGYGRGCRARIRAAALARAVADFTPQQITRALELIADNGIVPTARPGVFRSVSSDGTTTYLTHHAMCTCAGARHRSRCYHIAAARMINFARKAA